MTPTLVQAAIGDRYRIERELGAGGMATVYLAHDVKHDRLVAVKVMKPEFAAALGARHFLREIETAARLNHPHVVPLYDSGQADGFLYFVMPYIPGESLRERLLREKQLPLGDVVKLSREIAHGLAYAHSLGIVHCDIKPANILLSGGHAVVADFGIAHAMKTAGDRLTQTGLTLGTPTYMSPEQTCGDGALDARSDQYSMACMVYEMLAGDPPFTGATTQAILARKAAGVVPSLRTVRGSVPAAMEAVVTRGLARIPADRFASVEEFAAALELAAGTGEVLARAGTLRPSLEKLSLAVLLVVGVLGLSWWWFAGVPPRPQPVDMNVAADFPGPPHPAGRALQVFEEGLAKRIPGSNVHAHYTGYLTVREAFDALKDGSLEATWGQFGKVPGEAEPWAQIIAVPGLLTTIGAVDVLDSLEATKAILFRFETRHGIKVLGTGHMSARAGFASRRRIQSAADLRGLRVRSMSDIEKVQLEAWGAKPTTMAFSKIHDAVINGQLDAVVTTIGGWPSIRDQFPYYTTAAPYFIVGDHYWFGVSRRWWNALAEPTRQALHEFVVDSILPLEKQLTYCVDSQWLRRFGTSDPAAPGIYLMSPTATEELGRLRDGAIRDWMSENTPPDAQEIFERFVADAARAVAEHPPGQSWIEQTECAVFERRGLISLPR